MGIRQSGKCTFCHNEKEDLMHLFWQCKKQKYFGRNCEIASVATDSPNRQPTTHRNRFGSYAWQLRFQTPNKCCCLMAKHYIWICWSKELYPTRNNFLIHLKHIHHLENRTPSNTKKLKPFLSSLDQVSWALDSETSTSLTCKTYIKIVYSV